MLKRKLDRRVLTNPAFAMETAKQELDSMGELAIQSLKRSIEAVQNGSRKAIHDVDAMEEDINQMDKMLTAFLVEVDNLSLTEHQHLIVKNMFYTISDIERIGDHSQNISELAQTMIENDITFSKKGTADLTQISDETVDAVVTSLDARKTGNRKTAYLVENMENRVDKMEDEFREKHIGRLSKGKCTPENGVIFLDILSNLERIADHANNIAGYVTVE